MMIMKRWNRNTLTEVNTLSSPLHIIEDIEDKEGAAKDRTSDLLIQIRRFNHSATLHSAHGLMEQKLILWSCTI